MSPHSFLQALDSQPAAAPLALPAECYVEEDWFRRELDAVFGRSWQLVAHSAQLTGVGDHVIAEIGRVPLVIVRGEPGTDAPNGLRALHNVCRHRAGPLATCDGRGARALICHYHGWTYALDGQLRGAPEMQDAPDFDVTTIRLPRAHIAEWRELVFASLAPGMDFDQLITGVDESTAELSAYRFDRRVSYEIACNWKVYVDNFLEGYHLPRVHPALNRLLDYRNYRTELARWSSLQWSPMDAAQGPYQGGDAIARYWWLWPNTMLNVLPGRLQTNRVLPLSAARCRVDFDYYYPADADAGADAGANDRAFADEIQAEDVAICEAVQRGLASGSYDAGRLNPTRESGVWHFQELLRAAVTVMEPTR